MRESNNKQTVPIQNIIYTKWSKSKPIPDQNHSRIIPFGAFIYLWISLQATLWSDENCSKSHVAHMMDGSRSFCPISCSPGVVSPELWSRFTRGVKRCVNIPYSKKPAHKHKFKCGLSVRAKRLHTLGETTLGEQDIGRNDRNSDGSLAKESFC